MQCRIVFFISANVYSAGGTYIKALKLSGTLTRKTGFWTVAYAGFSKRGGRARRFRKFENKKVQNENFYTQSQSVFPVQIQVKINKKNVFYSNLARFIAKN